MQRIVKILIWIFLPIFLVLFITDFFVENSVLRTIEYVVDAILLVLIGLELFLFGGKDEKKK